MAFAQRRVAVGLSVMAFPLFADYAADIAPSLKPGLWLTTTSVRAAGAHDWPEAELAQLPPEERAHYEDAMKAAVAQSAQSHTFMSCLTAEELRGDLTFNFEHNAACKRTVVSTSATSWEVHEACGGPAQRTASARFSAASPGEISGETVVSLIKGERRLISKGTVHSEWLGADCGSVRTGAVIQQPNSK